MIEIKQSSKKFPCDFCELNSTSMVLQKAGKRANPVRVCNECIDDLSEVLDAEKR